MSYVVALLLDQQSQMACCERAMYLYQCVGQAELCQKNQYMIPLLTIENNKVKLEGLKEGLETIKAYSLSLMTAGITCAHDKTLVQRLVQNTALKTLQRKLIKIGLKYGWEMKEILLFPHIPYLTIAHYPVSIHPRLWMRDQAPFEVMGTALVLLEEEKMIHQIALPFEPTQYVYILECGDGSYYTGWTNDLEKRYLAHQSGKGAKYTKSHQPVQLVYVETFTNKKAAMRHEYLYKQMSHKAKAALIKKTKNSQLN